MRDLPRLGFGCSGIGNLYRAVSDEEAFETIEAALEASIDYFDVAPFYGFGLAERRLGTVLGACGVKPIVSTKVGRLLDPDACAARVRDGFVDGDPFVPHFDYGGEAILRSFSESLARLRLDQIDILLAHDLGTLTHGEQAATHLRAFLDSGYPMMCRLREEGAIAAIGIGVNEVAVCDALLDRVELDVILLAGRLTLLERDGALSLLERCRAAGTLVIAGGPYNSGVLAAPVEKIEDSHFDYHAPSRDIVNEVTRIARICDAYRVPMAAAALQFPLRHAGVKTVVAGMVGREQVKQNLRLLDTVVPDACWDLLAGTAQRRPALMKGSSR